jgi:predicted alpha/beta superfamily hydrolase
MRTAEYSPPLALRRPAARGDRYLSFLAETLKPMIDHDFRTLPDRAHTGIIGSSMGGLISLYAFFHRPETFGFTGALSPSLWLDGSAIFRYIAAAPFTPGAIYLDIGEQEGRLPPGEQIRTMVRDARRMKRTLIEKGYRLGQDLCYLEERGGLHNEEAWARRLPRALRFLLHEAPRDQHHSDRRSEQQPAP